MKLSGTENETLRERLAKTVSTAMKQGEGLIMILDNERDEAKYFSKRTDGPSHWDSIQRPCSKHLLL